MWYTKPNIVRRTRTAADQGDIDVDLQPFLLFPTLFSALRFRYIISLRPWTNATSSLLLEIPPQPSEALKYTAMHFYLPLFALGAQAAIDLGFADDSDLTNFVTVKGLRQKLQQSVD